AWPHPLNALRTLHAADVASWSARLAPVAAILTLVLFVAWRVKDPVARAGAILTVLPILPALPLPFLVGSYAEERAAYFASVGFCLLVGSLYAWGASKLPVPRPALLAVAAAIAAVAGWGTLERLPVWRDNITLLNAAAAAMPTDPGPHLTLVEHYVQDGNMAAALDEVERAIAIDPKSHAAYATKTMLMSRMARYPEAESAARKAIELMPRDAISYANLGDALLQQGKTTEAVAAGRRSVELDSTLTNAWYNLGVSLSAAGDAPGAIHAYEKAIEVQPNNVTAMNNLGALLGATGRLTETRDMYVKLLAIAPRSVESRMNLALAYLRLGDRQNAAAQREAVRRLDPRAVRQLDLIFADYSQTHPYQPPAKR
ncbi:MAG: tetratricopeptide repeat protein, partial [Candidatus Eiseniibacteriota bacterium]